MIVLPVGPAVEPAPLVCLDPGHARHADLSREPIGPGSAVLKVRDGGGARGEAAVVLQIAWKARRELRARGFRVSMTRRGHEFTYGAGGNADRAAFCNRAGADLMIRIHADGSTDRRRHGISTLYPAWRRGWTDDIFRPSRKAAGLLQRALVRATGARDLGIVARSDLTGFNWADVPAVLTELGFMTNPSERARLSSAAYQGRLARALAAGVSAFVGRR